MRVLITGGQAGDNPQTLPLLDGISMSRPGGRPRVRPEVVIADKGYSHPSTRAALRRRQGRFVGPKRDDQIARRDAKDSAEDRPPAFGP